MKASYSKEEYLALIKEVGGVKNKNSKLHLGNGEVKNKYKNQPVFHDGIRFDSKRERDRYLELMLLKRVGQIRDLRLQVSFELEPPVKLKGEKRTKPALRYVADFVYYVVGTDKMVVEDVKSPTTRKKPEYRIKKHKMKLRYDIDIEEIL